MRVLHKIAGWSSELGVGSPSGLCALIARQVYREWNAYGLRRDLNVPCEVPRARVPIAVRELRDDDIPALFDSGSTELSRRARLERMRRLSFLAARIPTPYVAVDLLHNRPCFLQWLMTAEANDEIQHYFHGRFPLLGPDEVLLEYAYTPCAYRGNGIMPAAMVMIAEKAAGGGARYVVTFVLRENATALKGCAKAGFVPYMLRRDRHYFAGLVRRRSFISITGSEGVHEHVVQPQPLTAA